MTEAMKRVLDPCCGSRMFWFDRRHPDVVYGDRRHETLTVTDRSHGRADGQRTLHIEPTACASAYGLCDQWQAPGQQQEEARAA